MPISSLQEFFIQWHLTERCNLRCTHCYQTGTRSEELNLTEIRLVLDEIIDMLEAWSETYQLEFSPSLNITGGEPFLRKDLFEILEEMSTAGFAIFLLTNGTLIDKEKAEHLARLGINGVQVSIEGPEEIHNSIRGKGSFAASCKGVSHLVKAGLRVTLNATLSEINAEKFQDMIDIATGLGVQKLGFSRLVPSGRGLDLVNRMIGRAEVKKIYESIFGLDTGDLKIVTGDPVASQMRNGIEPVDDCGSIATGGCAAGVSGLTILPDGTIIPCRRLPIPLGNVRQDSLREIWANSEILEQLRDRSQYKGKCGSCERWAVCRGCRAIAYAYSLTMGEPDILADDPQCFIEIT
ncbi:MAG: radical SAM protein [Desulfobulbaceae bacterium]|nr:radical SAM protein [Desulfobulbaceae bacterium]